MDVMVTPKRMRRASMPARITDRRKSLFGHGIDSPEMSPETYSPPLTSPSSWSDSPARTPVKTPIKSLQDGITQLAIEQTMDHPIGLITVQTTPTINGVRALSPDRGIVTPKTFYGKSTSLDMNRNLYDTVKERVRRAIVFAPRANQPFQVKKRSRSSDLGVRRRPAKTPKLSPTSKPLFKIKKIKSREKIEKPKVEKKIEGKKLQKKTESKQKMKQVYNWQFFNSSTPPTSKISSLFREKSSSVLTPPPSSRKRKKLISSYDMDHLKMNEESLIAVNEFSDMEEECQLEKKRRSGVDFTKSPMKVQVNRYSRQYGENIAEEIADDFSENDEEEEIVKDVEDIIEELNKDVTEVLEDVTEEEMMQSSDEAVSSNKNKLYPLFNMTPSSKSSKPERMTESKTSSGLVRAGRDNNQLILDVGQKNLREVVCSKCGLFYVKGDAVDEACHQKYHSQYRGLLYQSWKNQRVTGINGLDKIITVKGGDPKHWWQKVKDVLEIVDRELGFPPEEPVYSELQVFMYVIKNKIVGCAVAKPVKYAHRVLPCPGFDAALCSEESYPVLVGISRLWVHPQHRRSGIASQLVDSIRKNYNFVKFLRIDEIAFSSPTEEGRRFAAKYCKREDYLVYTFEC